MRYLRDYRLFENRDGLTDEQREFLDKNTDRTWSVNREGLLVKNTHETWSVNSEGLVDVEGDFNCCEQGLEDFLGIMFGKVTGNFWCNGNQLRTLKGSPREVGKGFYCSKNPLISLEGAPKVIKGGFRFKETWFLYNLQYFLKKIDHMKPEEISLLLTHHFFTVDVIKEQITENPDFPYYVSLAWKTEGFKKTQEELKKILPKKILVKIDDLWSIGGYLYYIG